MATGSIERLTTARKRFRRFFEELSSLYLERDDVLTQIALALLGKEHVLVTGPPGTAKSSIATAVVRRIVDEHTGEPSVFSRQLTESTVQTDLIGPIDFKALTETGRTEHFTDEGMLGAIHAHLDEVLDGRDMLLRTTLNVLHERELKQGTKVTLGSIECALMTSNRYLAEILESSRENLLAFVDRVAFLAFVPKGFADPEHLVRILASQTSAAKPAQPQALLTIQDVDELQAAVGRVHVPEPMLRYVGTLLERFEEETELARRADPLFVPTRYLSTRTAVRMASAMKAACVYRQVMGTSDSALEVTAADISMLRLGLLLSGPTPKEVDALLLRTRDPRERRQLSIIQTEREIFDRVLEATPPPKSRRRTSRVDVDGLTAALVAAEKADSDAALKETAQKLASAASTGLPGADDAALLLERSVDALTRRAVRVGVAAPASATPLATVQQLSDLAEELESLDGQSRPTSLWLRARALELIAYEASVAPERHRAAWLAVDLAQDTRLDLDRALARSGSVLDELDALRSRWRGLEAFGARESAEANARWAGALTAAESTVAGVFDRALAHEVSRALADVSGGRLSPLLDALRPVLDALGEAERRLTALGHRGPAVKSTIVAARLLPLIAAAFERLDASDRPEMVDAVGALLDLLEAAHVADAVGGSALLSFAAESLLRSHRLPEEALVLGPDGFERLSRTEPRVSITGCLVDIAGRLRARADGDGSRRAPRDPVGTTHGLLAEIPPAIRARVAVADLGWIARRLALLEGWWDDDHSREGDHDDDEPVLEAVVDSGFLDVVFTDRGPLRVAREARWLASLLDDAGEAADDLVRRAHALHERCAGWVEARRTERADEAWQKVLGS